MTSPIYPWSEGFDITSLTAMDDFENEVLSQMHPTIRDLFLQLKGHEQFAVFGSIVAEKIETDQPFDATFINNTVKTCIDRLKESQEENRP